MHIRFYFIHTLLFDDIYYINILNRYHLPMYNIHYIIILCLRVVAVSVYKLSSIQYFCIFFFFFLRIYDTMNLVFFRRKTFLFSNL